MTEQKSSIGLNFMCPSPGWVHPGDVMKTRKLKAKRRALQARMNQSLPLQILMPSKSSSIGLSVSGSKRRNPFKCMSTKVQKVEDQDADSSENSSDGALFKLLHSKPHKLLPEQDHYEMSNILRENQINNDSIKPDDSTSDLWLHTLPADWSLKSKIRFYSSKPLPWKHTFKTSEEASGTTGFVRCLKSEISYTNERRLDTSANAKFYECCLIWQHPSLPSVSLFPRDKQKITPHPGIYGTDAKIVSELHSEWSESLRSLYQLLRVRQCPYFYVCAHNFTCLFRAAGVGGVSHTHALITPTTRGFREVMKSEGVEFSMPFFGKKPNSSEYFFNKEQCEQENTELEDSNDSEEELENEETSSFLEDLGLERSQFPGLNQNRVKKESKKYKGIDGSPQSLVYVEDMELQGFINFLLNCGSCVITTGVMAGVPPTLLSPVSFQGGTLKSLKISGGQVRNAKGEMQHSIEIRGPILPTTVLHLTSLLASSIDSFSASLLSINSTLPFSSFLSSAVKGSMPMAFASEGLVDCGLGKDIRSTICVSNIYAKDKESEERLPLSFKDIFYNDGKYKWSDKL